MCIQQLSIACSAPLSGAWLRSGRLETPGFHKMQSVSAPRALYGKSICFLRHGGSWEGCWCVGGSGSRGQLQLAAAPSPAPRFQGARAVSTHSPSLSSPSTPPAHLCLPALQQQPWPSHGWFLQPLTEGISRTREFNYLSFLPGGHEPVSPLNLSIAARFYLLLSICL